jgi:hypothetical protein
MLTLRARLDGGGAGIPGATGSAFNAGGGGEGLSIRGETCGAVVDGEIDGGADRDGAGDDGAGDDRAGDDGAAIRRPAAQSMDRATTRPVPSTARRMTATPHQRGLRHPARDARSSQPGRRRRVRGVGMENAVPGEPAADRTAVA